MSVLDVAAYTNELGGWYRQLKSWIEVLLNGLDMGFVLHAPETEWHGPAARQRLNDKWENFGVAEALLLFRQSVTNDYENFKNRWDAEVSSQE